VHYKLLASLSRVNPMMPVLRLLSMMLSPPLGASKKLIPVTIS
jgi:hypothetical protein